MRVTEAITLHKSTMSEGRGSLCVMGLCLQEFPCDRGPHTFPSLHRHKSKKKAFTNAAQKWQDSLGKKMIKREIAKMKKYCSHIRIIAHTQVCATP